MTTTAPGGADQVREAGVADAGNDIHGIVSLYNQHAQRVLGYCMKQLGNRADAEDAMQDTFLRAAPRLGRLVGDPLAYLMAIAHNVCYDLRRSTRHQASPLEELDKPDVGPGPDVQAVERSVLTRAWVSLNRQERSLLAHTYAGFSYDEIARRTGLSAKAVSVGICRARKRVRSMAALVAGLLSPLALLRGLRSTLRRAATTQGSALASVAASLDSGAVMAGLLAASVLPGVLVGTNSARSAGAQTLSIASTAAHQPEEIPGVAIAPAGASLPFAATPKGFDAGGRGEAGRAATLPAPPTPAVVTPVGAVTGSPTTQSTYFDSMTSSPNYSRDHTIFASGWVSLGCNAGQCPVLFVTHDGGHTWSQAGRTGYQHGPVLLPPAYPDDPTVFVASDTAGLLQSGDGGQSFTPVVPVPGVAALSPASNAGKAVVLFVPTTGGQALLYSQASRAVAPGPMLPLQFVATAVAFAGDSGHILIAGAHTSDPATAPEPVVLGCSPVSCTQTGAFPGDRLPVNLAVSPAFGSDHAVLASTEQHVALSLDGGASFTRRLSPLGKVTAVTTEAGANGYPTVLVASLDPNGTVPRSIVSRSTGGAASLSAIAGDFGAGATLHALLGLADGRLIAAVTSTQPGNQFGLRCSADGGTTWSTQC